MRGIPGYTSSASEPFKLSPNNLQVPTTLYGQRAGFDGDIASYPGHVGGGKRGLVSTVCACAKNPMISWGIVYHRLRTVNLYRILGYSSEARLSRTYPANMAGKSEDFDKALKFALCLYWKGRFHVESGAAGCDQMYLRW